MVLTPDFVFVHFPKTGGTFVTQALSRLYGGREGAFLNTDQQHNTCSDIPDEHRHKPIVAAIRNPFEWYVSQYHFRWWAKRADLFGGHDLIQSLYPHFPDLTFAEFLQLANTQFIAFDGDRPTVYVNRHFASGRELGWETREFVRFFFREPRDTYAQLDERSLEREHLRRLAYPVTFLSFERLNDSLYELLLEYGHPAERIGFIRGLAKIFPTEIGRGSRTEGDRPPGDCWEAYYTTELLNVVRARDRLLFELFPHYDTVGKAQHA
jgi:hypothetical protein